MAVGTGLEPRRHGRRLAGALRRESEAGVLVAWKESGAKAGSQHPLPLQRDPGMLLAWAFRGLACPPLPTSWVPTRKPAKPRTGKKALLNPTASFNSPSAAGGTPRGLPCAAPLVCCEFQRPESL